MSTGLVWAGQREVEKTCLQRYSPLHTLLCDVWRLPGNRRYLLGKSYHVLPSPRTQLKCKQLPVGLVLQHIFKHAVEALPVPLGLRGQQHFLEDMGRGSKLTCHHVIEYSFYLNFLLVCRVQMTKSIFWILTVAWWWDQQMGAGD